MNKARTVRTDLIVTGLVAEGYKRDDVLSAIDQYIYSGPKPEPDYLMPSEVGIVVDALKSGALLDRR